MAAVHRPVLAIAALAAALAGCLQDSGPAAAEGPDTDGLLAAYRDCSWVDERQPGDCGDQHADGAIQGLAEVLDDVPFGWTCVADTFSWREEHPQDPVYAIYAGPPPGEAPQLPGSPLGYSLGILVDMGGLPQEVYPLQQVAKATVPEGPVFSWQVDAPRSFTPLPTLFTADEILLDGLVTSAVPTFAPIEREPTAQWNETYSPYFVVDNRSVPVEALSLNWGEHARWQFEDDPHSSDFPNLWATQVVRWGDQARYLPTFEFPIVGSPDPRTEEGSGHWFMLVAGVDWTKAEDGNASVRIQQPVHLRWDLHMKGMHQRLAEFPTPCECQRVPLTDVGRFLECRSPLMMGVA